LIGLDADILDEASLIKINRKFLLLNFLMEENNNKDSVHNVKMNQLEFSRLILQEKTIGVAKKYAIL